MAQLINETLNLLQKIYTTKSGKTPLLIYIDPKTSTDSTFDMKDKLKEYGMIYLPSKLGNYVPHSWGWILWDGEEDKQMSFVKRFINDLPSIETAGENGTRGFDDITSNFDQIVQEILRSIEAADSMAVKTAQDAEAKKRIEDFKEMVAKGLDDPATQEFLENLIRYRNELKKHNAYNLGWTNVVLAYFARNGKATQVRPVKEWEKMGYKPKEGIAPIVLIGKGSRYIPYSKAEKDRIIADYLREKGVNSIDELPQSSLYDLKNRRLKGKTIYGSEYQYAYNAYDVADVEPIEGVEQETKPEEPDNNWWWDKLPADEKDNELTNALISFAKSEECGRINIILDNEELGGARGNATNKGDINLINDQYIKFPTAVHELTHQLRHWEYASMNNPALKRFYNNRNLRDAKEQEADLCAAFVSSRFGYPIRSRLNYLHGWGLTKETCGKVFDEIAATADFIEKGVIKYMEINHKNNDNK